ncbi:MAG: hypothetical protein RLZZ196_3234, partial [Bacteroidota bacterium]
PMEAKVVTFSNKPIYKGENLIKINTMSSRIDYNEIVLKHLWPFIETEYFLIVQYDGFAVNKDAWSNEFLTVDYIGAPWKSSSYFEKHNMERRIGNGGFCLRSKKLVEALRDPEVRMLPDCKNGVEEDRVIGDYHRDFLESKYSIKFASYDLASKFSYELGPERPEVVFGTHGIWNVPYYLSEEESLNFFQDINVLKGRALEYCLGSAAHNGYGRVIEFLDKFKD